MKVFIKRWMALQGSLEQAHRFEGSRGFPTNRVPPMRSTRGARGTKLDTQWVGWQVRGFKDLPDEQCPLNVFFQKLLRVPSISMLGSFAENPQKPRERAGC